MKLIDPSSQLSTLPAPVSLTEPRVPVTIRPATLEDLPFIDQLQTKNARQLGYFHRGTLVGKISAGQVMVAEVTSDETKETRVGFVIGADRYFKREDCGVIYQLCVEEGARRALVGAMLVKAMFDRAAYGCRLFCCWCAQDIEANRFWESLGFVPLAFRAGSRKKARVHIFWQKRIRPGDQTTPWWFPSQTTGGAIRADRLVLPIPPGKHWRDEMPRLLPEEPKAPAKKPVQKWIDPIAHLSPKERRKLPVNITSGLRFMVPAPEPVVEKQPAAKNDPKLIALARELRDRWLEEVERDPSLLLPAGKYDLARALPEPLPHGRGSLPEMHEIKALPQAA